MTITITNENVDDIRKKYFGGEEDEEEEESWCELSQTRLFIKFAQFKPAGVSRHLNMVHLIHSLSHIYADEKDTNFRDYLSEQHYKELKKSNLSSLKAQNTLKTYPPVYQIRPTSEQIEEKLNEYYSMEQINENEIIPSCLLKQIDFYLPPWLMERVETPSSTASLQPQTSNNKTLNNISMPPPSKSRAVRRKRAAANSPDAISNSSRASTPNSAKK